VCIRVLRYLYFDHPQLGPPRIESRRSLSGRAQNQRQEPEDGVAAGLALPFPSIRHTASKCLAGEWKIFLSLSLFLVNGALQNRERLPSTREIGCWFCRTLPGCGRTKDVLGTVRYILCQSCTMHIGIPHVLSLVSLSSSLPTCQSLASRYACVGSSNSSMPRCGTDKATFPSDTVHSVRRMSKVVSTVECMDR